MKETNKSKQATLKWDLFATGLEIETMIIMATHKHSLSMD